MVDIQEINDLKLDVGLLRKDFENVDRLCFKLSETIEKMQEVNANLTKIISIHEQKHAQHLQTENELKDDVKELHSRITTVNRELYDKMNQLEAHISQKIEILRKDLLDSQKEEQKENSQIKGTLKEFDKYKWMIIGASLGFGWLVGNVNLNALAAIFK